MVFVLSYWMYNDSPDGYDSDRPIAFDTRKDAEIRVIEEMTYTMNHLSISVYFDKNVDLSNWDIKEDHSGRSYITKVTDPSLLKNDFKGSWRPFLFEYEINEY